MVNLYEVIGNTLVLVIGYVVPFVLLSFVVGWYYGKRTIQFVLTLVLSSIAVIFATLVLFNFEYLKEYTKHHENYTFETKQNYELVTSGGNHPFIHKDNGYTILMKADDHSEITEVDHVNPKEIKFETTTKKPYVTKEVYTLNEPFYEKYFSLIPFMKLEEQKLEMYKLYLNEDK